MTIFTKNLLLWYKENQRAHPWKETKNPYHIWLSEIILQQTRIEQGTPYFLRFKEKYPSIIDLANAPEDEVMRLWEGLGYYSRARNLHATAKYVALECNGVFPNTHKNILALKGVGPYTAAAIASFAYDLPHAVVDGNVYRVLGRYFNISEPIDTTQGKKQFAQLADQLLLQKDPATYNQAIMDFGATQCVPVNPACETCIMRSSCKAYQKGTVTMRPIKSKKTKQSQRFFHYLVISTPDQKVYLNKRLKKDIWQNLYEFPMIEKESLVASEELNLNTLFKDQAFWLRKVSSIFRQQLSHQKIHAQFLEIQLKDNLKQIENHEWIEVPRNQLDKYAFPRIINTYLEQCETGQNRQLLMDF